jgi:hypothetical protein
MNDYTEIKKKCEEASSISRAVIDDFLLHYAAAKDNLAREFDTKIVSYRHITQKADASWIRLMKSQYIIHRVFKADGLLRKYLNHSEIKRRPSREQDFMKQQLAMPWRFSFSEVVKNPAPDFYEMRDVFRGDNFLLYSKTTTQTLKEQSVMLWLNLVAFNGTCWQTFGPVNAFQSFDSDDIFFFATEVNPNLDSDEALILDVEKNPLPYMHLLHGGRMPVTVNKKDELLILFSENDLETIDVSQLKAHFKVEYNEGVFRISLPEWEEPPHLAAAYFDEGEKLLVVSAMTDRGFSGITRTMNKHGLDFPPEPQVRIHPSMLVTAESILRKKIILNSYENLFTPESTPQEKAEFEKLNRFFQSVLPAINAGEEPDIKALAKIAGVDEELAEKIVADTIRRIKTMKKGS